MKTIISPAKNMVTIDNIKKPIIKENIKPQTIEIYNKLKNFNVGDFSAYMNVNNDIALKSFIYYQDIDFEGFGTPAIFSYNGIQYKNIEPFSFNDEDINFASNHISIISAFYGLLKADTPIQPYRLEMGGKINFDGENLYKLWGTSIYCELFKNETTVLNLASDEYSKAIKPFLNDNDNFITVKFMKYSKGKYKTFATDAKISRGKMVNFIVKNKINNLEDIKNFCENDYNVSENFSDKNNFVFCK